MNRQERGDPGAGIVSVISKSAPPPEGAGLLLLYHPNGTRHLRCGWSQGKPDGACVVWYESGHIQASAHFVAGRLEGRWEAWHENGVKKEEGQYQAGIPTGLWMSWSEAGAPLPDSVSGHRSKPKP